MGSMLPNPDGAVVGLDEMDGCGLVCAVYGEHLAAGYVVVDDAEFVKVVRDGKMAKGVMDMAVEASEIADQGSISGYAASRPVAVLVAAALEGMKDLLWNSVAQPKDSVSSAGSHLQQL